MNKNGNIQKEYVSGYNGRVRYASGLVIHAPAPSSFNLQYTSFFFFFNFNYFKFCVTMLFKLFNFENVSNN